MTENKRIRECGANLQGSGTIVLAEDEDIVRKLVREVLETYGYRVLEAASGGTALLICEQHQEPIDLLLTDVVMPDMSGLELANRLAQLRPEMKVLFMSGHTDDAIVRHGVLEEEVLFIQKPFAPDDLARKVKEVLGSSKCAKINDERAINLKPGLALAHDNLGVVWLLARGAK